MTYTNVVIKLEVFGIEGIVGAVKAVEAIVEAETTL